MHTVGLIVSDLTEKKEAEATLRKIEEENARVLEQKNSELEKMNKELQSFAYISSHDLQEPLRKIQTFVSLIREKEEKNLSDSGKNYFTRMQTSAKRMQSLIDDLLAYSRTGGKEKNFETVALTDIVDQVLESLEEEIRSKKAKVEVSMDCEAMVIPFQFFQLLHNLVSNALKFSLPGVPPTVRIESQIATGAEFDRPDLLAKRRYCRISVSDNGIGFDPQYNERIFELFQRLHGKDVYQGTGIGLAIVKRIVENHEGIITVESVPNQGTRFDIYIPSV
jgi:light-regulated signal transduction histidine kinase (bacteriophytochrome)